MQNNGRIEGSCQQLTGEGVNFNSGAVLLGDFLVPGTPTVQLNGTPNWSGQQTGTGSASPSGYTINVNSGVQMRYLVKRTDAVTLTAVAAPPAPAGTRQVNINSASDASAIGNWATVRDLTLNSNAGNVAVPAGTYGAFNASNGNNTGFVFGAAGATQVSVYNLQSLTLNSNSRLTAAGPVVLNVAGQVLVNSNTAIIGSTGNSGWLQLNDAGAGVTLNSGSVIYGAVNAPAGTINVNGKIAGTAACNQLTINSGGVITSAVVPNQAPTVGAGTAQTITLPAGAALAGTVTDDGLPAGAAVTSTWSKVSGPGTVTFANAAAPQTSAGFSVAGTYVLQLSASDTALSSSATVTITVNPANQAPAVSAGAAQAITLPAGAALAGTVTDDGLPAGAAVTSTWSKVSGPGTVTFANAAAPQTSAGFSTAGTYVLKLAASDTALSSSATVTITVAPQNQPPQVGAGPAQTIRLPAAVNLAGAATDDGLPAPARLTVNWTQVSGPGTVTFAAPGSASTQAGFSADGTYVLRLTASDTQLSAASSVTITVLPANKPPVVSAGPAQSITLPAAADLAGTVSDDGVPTGAAVTSTWRQISGPGTVAFANGASPATSATFDQAGTYVLRLSASDTELSASADVTVAVAPQNQPPQVSAGPDQTIRLPAKATLAGAVTDDGLPTGAAVTRSWRKLSGPGTVTFSDATLPGPTAAFSAAGTYVLQLSASDTALTATAQVTVTVQAAPPADASLGVRTSQGTDFWLTFLEEPIPYFDERHEADLLITADADASGTISMPAKSGDGVDSSSQYHVNFNVRAGHTITVHVPGDAYGADQVTITGLHVTADKPVSVSGLMYSQYSSDAFLALPTSLLGTEYLALGYGNGTNAGSQFAVVATADATVLTITPACTILSDDYGDDITHPAGVAYTVNLTQGQVYELRDSTPGGDISGTVISANLPVAVFAGHRITSVPHGQVSGNYLIEELPPTALWGKEFVTAPLATRQGGDVFRFLASVNGTRITINGEFAATLDRGQISEQLVDGAAAITASQPILVAQYSRSRSADSILSEYGDIVGPTDADPSMSLVPPRALFASRYGWGVPLDGFPVNYVNVTVDNASVGLVTLDDAPVAASAFAPIGNSGYSYAQLPIAGGSHHLAGPAPFGALTYGFAYADAYSCPAGLAVPAPADLTAALKLSTPAAANPTGQAATVTALLTDTGGASIANAAVTFRSTGVNPASATVLTDLAGRADFTFTGANSGTDMITATANGAVAATAAVNWVDAAPVNRAPWVDPGFYPYGTVRLPDALVLNGTALDDGLPAPSRLTSLWSVAYGPGNVSFDDPTQPSTRATFSAPGDYTLKLEASDGSDLPPTYNFIDITVLAANAAPVVTAAPAAQTVDAFTPASLAGTVDDDGLPAGHSVIVQWRKVRGPGTVAFSTPFQTATDASFGQPGIYLLRLTADDGDLRSGASVQVTVQLDPAAPRLTSIIAPTDGAQTRVGRTIALKAAASDPESYVSRVEYYSDGVLLGDAAFAPYEFDWTPQDVGDHQLVAKAYNELGMITPSAPITVSVTSLPSIRFLAPLGGTPHLPGDTINVALDVQTPGSSVMNVSLTASGSSGHFFSFGGPDAPYAYTWENVPEDDYRLTAEVTNAQGLSASATLYLNVRPPPDPAPLVHLTAPADGSVVLAGRPLTVAADASVPGGKPVGHVAFYAFGGYSGYKFLGNITEAPYQVTWTPAGPGDYELVAYAYNAQGISTISESVWITVNTPPPVVQLTAPANGAVFAAGDSIPLTANATQTGGAIDHVEFSADGVDLGDSVTAPYALGWNAAPLGSHVLTATAFGVDGQTTVSASARIAVQAVQPVQIIMTDPADGMAVNLNDYATLEAGVNNGNGRVASTKFFANGVLIADGTQLDGGTNGLWLASTAGTFQLIAAADDAAGTQLAVSDPVTVQVRTLTPPQVTITNPRASAHLPASTSSITIHVQGTGADGVVTQLEAMIDQASLTQAAGSTLDCVWNPQTPGWHEIEALGTDDTGQQNFAEPVGLFIERPVTNALPAPANLEATATDSRKIHLAWTAPPEGIAIAGTVVERRVGLTGSWEEIGSILLAGIDPSDPQAGTGFTFDDGQVVPEAYYSYRVAFLTADGQGTRSLYSPEASATTLIDLPTYIVVDLGEELDNDAAAQGVPAAANRVQRRPGVRSQNGRHTAAIRRNDQPVGPINLGENYTPLWIADDGSVLLRSGGPGSGTYVTRRFDGRTGQINDPSFTAHRLTRDGTLVVGERQLSDSVSDRGLALPHSQGVRWRVRDTGNPKTVDLVLEPVTSPTRGAYRYPLTADLPTARDATGWAYRGADSQEIGATHADLPTLDSLWDINASGQAAATVTVYLRPDDKNANQRVDDDTTTEVFSVPAEIHDFDARGAMQWTKVSERGNSLGYQSAPTTRVFYDVLLASAVRLNLGSFSGDVSTFYQDWTWLGPLTYDGIDVNQGRLTSGAKLINDGGTLAGYAARPYSAIDMGGATQAERTQTAVMLNNAAPTHAFRWKANRAAYYLSGDPVLTDLDALPGGLHSYPEAINRWDEIAGYGDTEILQADGYTLRPDAVARYHAIFWAGDSNAPVDLGTLAAQTPLFPVGYSRAYDLDDDTHIVGESIGLIPATPDPNGPTTEEVEGVLWGKNKNTGGSGPFWDIDNLNVRLNDKTNWHISRAVGINRDGLIIASAERAIYEDNGHGGRKLVRWSPRAILLLPVDITILRSGTGTPPANGVLVQKYDTVNISLFGDKKPSFQLPAGQPVWKFRQMIYDPRHGLSLPPSVVREGAWTDWQNFGTDGIGSQFDHVMDKAGVFQVEAVFFGDDENALKHVRKLDEAFGNHKKGDPDAVGVAENAALFAVCSKARSFVGTATWSKAARKWPAPADTDKCNIFVGQVSTMAGALVPFINGRFFSYPPTANQWAGVDDTDRKTPGLQTTIENWSLLPADASPQPGFIMAHPDAGMEGHCGIVDYDGWLISAHERVVDKDVHLMFDGSSRQRNYYPINKQ